MRFFGGQNRYREVLKKADLVIDRGDARGQPGCSFRFLPLGPGTYFALKDCFASLHLNGDVVRVDLRAPNQRILDLLLQVGGACERLHRHQVAYPLDTPESPYRALSFLPFVLPFHFTLEGYPAVVDGHMNLVRRNACIPLQCVYCGSRNVAIRTLADGAYRYIVGDGSDSIHAMGSLLGFPLIQVGVHGSCKRDDTVFDRYTDILC